MAVETSGTDAGISIGDVAKVCGVRASTIRFWEKEFGLFLLPRRTKGGQRRYCDADIARVMEIRKLLREDGFTIKGAKKMLQRELTFAFASLEGERNPAGSIQLRDVA